MSYTRLFVSNLPNNTNGEDLRNAFSTYGEVLNLDIKTKSEAESNPKTFAFVTLSASNYEVETCIKQLSNEDFNGSKLYVTRARESFLERLQREREQAKQKTEAKNEESQNLPSSVPIIRLGDKLNPRKRKFDDNNGLNYINSQSHKTCTNIDLHEKPFGIKTRNENFELADSNAVNEINSTLHKMNKKDDFHEKPFSAKKYIKVESVNNIIPITDEDKKKYASDLKRIESMSKKRQEFRQKKNIIKSGLDCIDKTINKKIIFSDGEDDKKKTGSDKSDTLTTVKKKSLLEDEDGLSDEEVLGNIELKKQFETKNGQRILDLQSRYKSEKRFILDERYFEEDPADKEEKQRQEEINDQINLNQSDEKIKQLNILQDILGVELKSRDRTELNKEKKKKPTLGMLRFDPMQPEHAKFLVPVETKNKQDNSKKSKKKKDKKGDEEISEEPVREEKKVEVSKEQFYRDSETLKDISLVQPIQFSLRSLFAKTDEEQESEKICQDTGYTEIETKNKNKAKNPLVPKEKNPFVYDSSETESEDEDINKQQQKAEFPQNTVKAVWNENLFFSKFDERLKEGLLFFNKKSLNEGQKDRRELKYLMKKRANNNEKKNQMFQKKIGGKKKAIKKLKKNNK